MEMYFKRMKDEWTGLVEQADPLIRAKAAEIAVAHAHYLSICVNCLKKYRATKSVWMY